MKKIRKIIYAIGIMCYVFCMLQTGAYAKAKECADKMTLITIGKIATVPSYKKNGVWTAEVCTF